MKRLWMFLLLTIAVSVASIPVTGWAQTSSSSYRIERFGVDSLINSTTVFVNIREIVTIKISVNDYYVFCAAASNLSRYDAVWRYDSRNKEWKNFGAANGLPHTVWAGNTIFEANNIRLLAGEELGIYISDDFGEHWRYVFVTENGLINTFAKTKGGTIYAGGSGLFRSTDNGETWVQVLSKADVISGVSSIAVMPSGVILAGLGTGGIYGYGIFKSNDNGRTWFHSEAGLDSLGKNIVELAAVGGFSRTVFAATDYGGGLWRSDDDGENWYKVNVGPDRSMNAVSVTPMGVFAGFGGGNNNLFRSVDFGYNWQYIPGVADHVLSFGWMKANELLVGTADWLYLITFDNPLPVEPHNSLPTAYSLFQNYPNPFNPTTKIDFALKSSGRVALKVYNLLGQEVATLVDGYKTAGYHSVVFNASNLPSGIYIYTLNAEGIHLTKRMILMK